MVVILIWWASLFLIGCAAPNGCPYILDLFLCGGEDTGTGNPNAQPMLWAPSGPVYVSPYARGYVISNP